MQLDKPPLIESIENISKCLEVLCQVVKTAKINRNQAMILSSDEFLCATDLAEYLVKKGMAFKEAHITVGKVCAYALKKKMFLSEIPLRQWNKFSKYFKKDIYNVLKPEVSVAKKRSYGGTSLKNIQRQLQNWKRKI